MKKNDSLITLILVGVTGFREGWKGCLLWGQGGSRSGTMFCIAVGRIIKQGIRGQRLIREKLVSRKSRKARKGYQARWVGGSCSSLSTEKVHLEVRADHLHHSCSQRE